MKYLLCIILLFTISRQDQGVLDNKFLGAVEVTDVDPVNQFGYLIDKISSEITENTELIAETSQTRLQQCQSYLQDLSSELQDQQVQLGQKQNELDILQKDFDSYSQDLNQISALVDDNTKNLEKGKQRFEQTVQKGDTGGEMLQMIDQALSLISKLQSGTSYAEIQGKFVQLSDSLDITDAQASLFKPIVDDLAQLKGDIDKSFYTQTQDLLSKLRQNIVESQNQSQIYQEKQKQNWDSQQQHLADEQNNLKNRKDTTMSSYLSIQSRLKESQASFDDLKEMVSTTQSALDAQKELCDSTQNSLDESLKSGQQQKSQIQEIRTTFDSIASQD